MNKKLILILFAFIFLAVAANSDLPELVFSMGKNYGISVLSASNPVVGQALNFALNPEATLTSLGIDQINKVIPGFSEALSFAENPKDAALNKILTEVAKSNPELFQEISKSLNILDKVKQAADIINDLQVQDGKIVHGELNTNKELDLREQFDKEFRLSEGWNLKSTNEEIDITLLKENAEFRLGENIYKNLRKAIFKVNKTGSIAEAYIEINNDGSILDFNDIKQFNAAPNSKLIYKDNILYVVQDEKSESNYLNHIIKGLEFNIKGNEVYCKECYFGDFKLLNGNLEVVKNGYLAKSGLFQYKELEFVVDEFRGRLFVTDKDTDYDGNYLVVKDKSIEINSKDKVDVTVLGNNRVFNTDDKDKLNFYLARSNLKILNRNEQGLTPKINYQGDFGSLTITNNDILIDLSEDKITANKPKNLVRDVNYYNKPYQSVAFDLENNENKLRINSYSQYTLLDKNNEESVSYNGYDLPISNTLVDNSCQDIECLSKKYSTINFTIPKFVEGPNSLFEYGEVHPFMIYYTDVWISQHPGSLSKIEEIGFSDIKNAYHRTGSSYIGLGEGVINPIYGFEIRDTKPLDILTHEYEHLLDDLVRREEIEYLKEIDPEYAKLEQGLEENTKNTIDVLTKIAELKKMREYPTSSEEEGRIELIDEEIKKLREEHSRLYDEYLLKYGGSFKIGSGDKYKQRLSFLYNKQAINYINNIFSKDNEEKFKRAINPFNQFAINFLRDRYREEFYTALHNVDERDTETDVEEILSSGSILEKPYYINLITGEMRELQRKSKKKVSESIDVIDSMAQSANSMGRYMQSEKSREYAMKVYSSQVIDTIMDLQGFYNRLDERFPNLGKYMESIAEDSGAPSLYVLRNYQPGISYSLTEENLPKALFGEVSSTFREEPLEAKKTKINSANQKISQSYQLLTQLAFDSGKMDVAEYNAITGNCKTPDCIEFRCIEYKLLCCRDYPNSPNCKS